MTDGDGPRPEGGAPEVCLVSMPYASLARPSLALGLLTSILTRAGVRVTTANANLWFAEQVGLRLYHLASAQAPAEFLVGEWTFARAAFPDWAGRDEEYLARIAETDRYFPMYRSAGGAPAVAELRDLRAAATEFIEATALRVLATGARVVGCTSTFEQHVASLALLRRIHELDPSVITMMGGANCETTMGETTHRCFPWVDYVVSGEADGLIVDLCRLALDRGRDVAPGDLPRGVLGPGHRDQGEPRPPRARGLPRALFRDLDSLPAPRFDEYFQALASSPLRASIRPGLPLETSRGCWWGDSHQCTFCGLNGSSLGFRSKSADRVLAEVHELEERYQISRFEVVDNILDMSYFKSVLPALAAEGRPRDLFYEVKANLSRRHVEALVQAGVRWVQPGIESLHTEVLRLMDKGIRGWQNIQLLKWARELGLRLSWSLLWGFPGEKDEYYQQMAGWIPFLEHLQAPGGVAHLRYDRYSVYHQRAQQMGLLLMPIRAMSHVYPLAPADLGGLAYFFTTEPGSGPLDINVSARGGLHARPGVQAFLSAAGHWRDAFAASLPPVLSMTDQDGVLDVLDSRACARAPRTRLTGLARAICLVCDAAPQAGQVGALVSRDHQLAAPPDEVGAVVSDLVAAGLVLPIDGRLVGLAVQRSIPALPDSRQFPGGYIDVHARQAEAVPARGAARSAVAS